MKRPVSVLIVMSPSERRRALLSHFDGSEVEILLAANCHRARQAMRARPDIVVTVTDLTLADGNWCDVLESTVHREIPASVVVVSPVGGERLWAEVLWRGAHDLLVEPLERMEICRTVEGAIRAARAAESAPGAASARLPVLAAGVCASD